MNMIVFAERSFYFIMEFENKFDMHIRTVFRIGTVSLPALPGIG